MSYHFTVILIAPEYISFSNEADRVRVMHCNCTENDVQHAIDKAQVQAAELDDSGMEVDDPRRLDADPEDYEVALVFPGYQDPCWRNP